MPSARLTSGQIHDMTRTKAVAELSNLVLLNQPECGEDMSGDLAIWHLTLRLMRFVSCKTSPVILQPTLYYGKQENYKCHIFESVKRRKKYSNSWI